MSDVQQRAAEVIHHELRRGMLSIDIAAALATANLLADHDTARLRALGEAVEKLEKL